MRDRPIVRGRVIAHREGFGFLIPETGGSDLFLNPRVMQQVFDQDQVSVRVVGTDYRGRDDVELVEIFERGTTEVVGRFFKSDQQAFVVSAHKRFKGSILIEGTTQAKPEQMVVVAITQYPSEFQQAIGTIKEILGDPNQPGIEVAISVNAYGIPHEWTQSVKAEVNGMQPEKITVPNTHRDLRDWPFVTIDGEEAKDFDDAVFAKRTGHDTWKLWVAIADVSHYVKPETALDQAAYLRGNSVYFADQVIPMLPEILSNDLCSLKTKH